MLIVSVQLQAQVCDDGVSVLDSLRMGGAFDGQDRIRLVFEAFLRRRVL